MTETYGLSFYLQYLAHWPEYFHVAEAPNGDIMGYSMFSKIHRQSCLLTLFYVTLVMGKVEGQDESWHGHVTAVTVASEYRRLNVAAKLMKGLEAVSEK